MKKLLVILVSFPLFCFSQLVPKSLSSGQGTIGFYEFKPAGYNPGSGQRYPLIIFLHGVGERGNGTTELPMVLNTSFPNLFAEGASMKFSFHGREASFLVLMPQMSKDYINWQNFYVDSMISYARRNLAVDTNRIFLCGWSLGGGGAWKYATSSLENARHIAGLVLAAPAPDYVDLSLIAKGNVAVWAHHAKDDASVPIRLTANAINTVNSYKPVVKALMTYYEKGGHSTARVVPFDTSTAFLDPNLYEWMWRTSKSNTLSNNRPPVPIAGNDTVVYVPTKITLDGSKSYDPNDVIVRYRWRLLKGPESPDLEIQSPYSTHAVVKGFVTGDYVFRLTVQDEFGFTRSSDVHLHAQLPSNGRNAVPYVNAGPDFATNRAIFVVKGHARDFDGKVLRYHWRQIDGPDSITIAAHNEYAVIKNMRVEGDYRIELSAFDNSHPEGIGRDTVVITREPAFRIFSFMPRRRNPEVKDEPGGPLPAMPLMLFTCLLLPLFIQRFSGMRQVRMALARPVYG